MSLPNYIINLEELALGIEEVVLNWDSQREGVLKLNSLVLEPSSRQKQLVFNSRVSIKKIIVKVDETYNISNSDNIKVEGAGVKFTLKLLNSVNYILKDLSSESENLVLNFLLGGDKRVELSVYYYDYEELEYIAKKVRCISTTGEIIREYQTFVHKNDISYTPIEIEGYEPTSFSFPIQDEIVVYYNSLNKIEFFINYYVENTEPRIFIRSDKFLEDKGFFTYTIPEYINGNFIVLGDRVFQTIVDKDAKGAIFEYFVRKEV